MQENESAIPIGGFPPTNIKDRKQLIPWWMKCFSWLFLIFAFIAPLGLIFGTLGYNFTLALYGLETKEPVSVIGLIITAIFFFKGLTALGLLRQKDWAIKLCIADAILGIVACTLIMLYPLVNTNAGTKFMFRLELLFLVPYLLRLIRIEPLWKNTLRS